MVTPSSVALLLVSAALDSSVPLRRVPPRLVAPVSVVVPPRLSMVPLMVLPPVALSVTFSALPLLPAIDAPLWILIVPLVPNVRPRVPPLLLAMATAPPLSLLPLTTMAPLPPLPVVVWMLTSVPALSAVLISVSPIVLLVSGSNRPPASRPATPCTMVTSAGSSSHWPLWPALPAASTRAPAMSSAVRPEVSTWPPCAPPRALMWPCMRVLSSAQTVT